MTGNDPLRTTSASIANIGLGVLVSTVGTATTLGGLPRSVYPSAKLSDQVRAWESPLVFSVIPGAIGAHHWQAVLAQFAERLVAGTIDPIPEFEAIAMEHFWDLA